MEYYWPDDRIGGYPEYREPGGGYGRPGYVDRGPLPELEYIDVAPDYYRTGTGRGGHAYPLQQQAVVPVPPVEYLKPERSDLGAGLRDSNLVKRRSHIHGAASSRSDRRGYGRSSEHAGGMRRLKKKVEQEEHQKHGFQAAAAAAVGYALHERHEKKEAEEQLKKLTKGKDKEEKKHRYHFYRGEGGLE